MAVSPQIAVSPQMAVVSPQMAVSPQIGGVAQTAVSPQIGPTSSIHTEPGSVRVLVDVRDRCGARDLIGGERVGKIHETGAEDVRRASDLVGRGHEPRLDGGRRQASVRLEHLRDHSRDDRRGHAVPDSSKYAPGSF